MGPARLPALQDAIRRLEGCEATHVESVPVCGTFEGRPTWEGEVQVFDLIDHPTASRANAWSHATHGAKRRFHVVLHAPPVNGPEAAVRAAIVARTR